MNDFDKWEQEEAEKRKAQYERDFRVFQQIKD